MNKITMEMAKKLVKELAIEKQLKEEFLKKMKEAYVEVEAVRKQGEKKLQDYKKNVMDVIFDEIEESTEQFKNNECMLIDVINKERLKNKIKSLDNKSEE